MESYDFIVIGSGLAGLAFALEASAHGSVCVLTKAEITESNTSYAQGGIAAAVGEADSWELHEQDTLIAGAGLCDPVAVRFLVQNAPAAIEWLVSLGASFDLRLGREGGHSRNRIVRHADRTGMEVERAVSTAVRANPAITVFEHAFVTELLMSSGRVVGCAARVNGLGLRVFKSSGVMLATGGCGKLYQHTTNPRVATGDGVALAARVGADIRDMEFMQFHPTTLYHPQMRSFLVTEAVRGAGGTLRNHLGSRFMYGYDDRLELAPRDIVARAIVAEMKRLETWCVYLDIAHLPRAEIEAEFPNICEQLARVEIAMHRDWIPVVPAQHYSCGGVQTDLDGCTSVPGLYAAGEVASTGVHGANRLASNSLLEAIVFARAAARHGSAGASSEAVDEEVALPKSIAEAEAVRLRRSLQKTMMDDVGIIRTTSGLQSAKRKLSRLAREYESLPEAPYSQYSLETANLLTSAKFVVEGALARRQNVGLHYNEDLVTEPAPNTAEAPPAVAAHLPTPEE